MYCSHCGKPLDVAARFCPACGAAVQAVEYPPPPAGEGITRGQVMRPRQGRVIAGVCAGLALHNGWDLALVRVICVLLVLCTGIGVVAYIIAWVVMPEEPYMLPQSTTGTRV